MATITDIAQAAGYAPTTVAEILRDKPGYNQKTRDHVLQIADQLNYEPSHSAKVLATGKTRTVGIVLGQLEKDLASPTFAPTLAELVRTLRRHGYHAPILPADTSESYDKQIMRLVRGRHVDGMFVARDMLTPETLNELARRKAPVVTIDEALPINGDIPINIVRRDKRAGMTALAEALVAAGHKRVAFVVGETPDPHPREQEHQRILMETFAEHGIVLNEASDVFRFESNKTSMFTEWTDTRAYAAKHQGPLLNYAAVVCRSDVMALAVASCLRETGVQIGRDIAIVGDGNLEQTPALMSTSPILTTRDPENAAVGRQAAELVCQQLKHPNRQPEVRHVPSRLVVRESFQPSEPIQQKSN